MYSTRLEPEGWSPTQALEHLLAVEVTATNARRIAGRFRFANIPAGLTLLVIDKLGYLPLPAEAASALFQVINQRYLKTTIVITTNRPVGAWSEILGDTAVATAMLDRLLHRSVAITLDGASYRLRNHIAASDELRRITTVTNLR